MASANYYSIKVTPTVLAGAADVDDVIFNPTAIPGAAPTLGGAARLLNVNVVYYDDYFGALDLYFFEKGDNNLGTLGAAISISDANLKANKLLGIMSVGAATSGKVGDMVGATAKTNTSANMILQAASGSSDIFVAGVAQVGHTFTADGIDLTFSFRS